MEDVNEFHRGGKVRKKTPKRKRGPDNSNFGPKVGRKTGKGKGKLTEITPKRPKKIRKVPKMGTTKPTLPKDPGKPKRKPRKIREMPKTGTPTLLKRKSKRGKR